MFKGQLREYQAEASERMTDRGQMLLGMVMGAGKGHPDGTPILTPTGFVNIEDLRVGDVVVGSDGSPTEVTGVYPRGVQPCYRVSFNDHTSTVVDSEHLWYVESPADRYKERQGKVLATWKLASAEHVEPGKGPYRRKFGTFFRDHHGNNRWSIPTCASTQFAPRDTLPIDPYTLGVILGDGSITPNSVLVHGHADDIQEVASHIVGNSSVPRATGTCWSFSIRGILPHLRNLGLMGTKSATKFVPTSYLLSSPADRLALLQGLMDTDGYAGKRGTVEFSSTSERLAEDVCFLVRSLGGYAYLRQKATTCVYKGEVIHGVGWRVTFKIDHVPFRLSRKSTSYVRPVKYKELRVIVNVEEVHPRFTTCISVAAPDHLYVIHDFIVTHNTPTTLHAVETLHDQGEIQRCLVVVPASLKYQWMREIGKFTDARVTVIDGPAKDRAALWRKSITSRYVVVNPESLINDQKFMGVFQCMVVDEATIIKNRTAKRSRLLKKVGKAIHYRFALTGQPIENRPEELFCADKDTQILSQRGWLSYSELTTDDIVLTLNHLRGEAEWQIVQAINQFSVQDHPMLRMEHRDHSSMTTLNHRWPVDRWTFKHGKRCEQIKAWATSESFYQTDVVPISAPITSLPDAATHSDALVELIAWTYTEGHRRVLRDGTPGSAINIAQNTETEGSRRIRLALTSLFGDESGPFPRLGSVIDIVPRWREDRDSHRHHSVFKLNSVAGATLLECAPDKVPSYEFLLSLTKEQLALFTDVSMLADNNGRCAFSQKDERAAEAFQFAQVLQGVSTSIRKHPKTDYDRQGNPYSMTKVTIRRKRVFRPYYCRHDVVPYTGVVWCPTTANGTWFSRRNGSTYFTGNSLMEFVDKSVLGDFATFDRTFIRRDHWGKPLRYVNLDLMYESMKEVMVRVTRDDIKDQLPDIIHTVIPVPFDTAGAHAYRLISDDLLQQLQQVIKAGGGFDLFKHYNGGDGDEAQGQIMARLTVLRMLCDNPDLVVGSARDYLDPTTTAGSAFADEIVKKGWVTGVSAHPKLDAVLEYIDDVLSEDPKNKVVVFSFFKRNLRIIQDSTSKMAGSVLFMGGMTAEEKDQAKEKFRNDPKCRIFLSSDAGGYGVDLPNANYLISYDLPWSSGKLEQREARIIRLSSEFPHVNIVTFVMQGSIEERQYDMLQHKRSVNEAFIDGKHHDMDKGMTIDVDTLSNFLRATSV